jgi:aminoglycoside 3-N-acetyltransferase
MSTGKLILSISPDLFKFLNRIKKKIKSLVYSKLSEESFCELLVNKLGVKKGSVVFIHSSIDNLNIDFPFYRLYYLILDLLGEDGTLLFPCWHFNYRAEEYLKKNELFDVRLSSTVMGILPEFARRQNGAFRSLHPTNSVVAIGKYANELTREHHCSVYPNGEKSPFYKIVKYYGIIIGLGVDTEHLSFVHCVEDIMGHKFPYKTRTDEIYNGRVITMEGQELMVPTTAAHKQIKNRSVNRFLKKNISEGICKNFKINGTKYFIAHSASLYLKMEQLAIQGKTIYDKKNEKNSCPLLEQHKEGLI